MPRSQSSAATTSRAHSAEPSPRRTRAPAGPKSTSAISPGPGLIEPRARATRGPRSNSGSATVKRPRRSKVATRLPSAPPRRGLTGSRRRSLCQDRQRAAQALVLRRVGIVGCPDVGPDPLAGQRAPFGVKYSPTVRSSAPPALKLDHLLEDALAERARADDRRQAVVAERRGEDLGRRSGVAVDQDDHRALRQRRPWPRSRDGPCVRLSVETTRSPLGRNRLAGQHGLVQQPAAVASQIEHQALGAAVDTDARASTGARRAPRPEARVSDVGDLARRPRAGSRPERPGPAPRRARGRTLRVPPPEPETTRSSTCGPRRALDARRGDLCRDARQRAAVHGDDQIALLDPGALGRRAREDARHPQPALDAGDGQARRPRSGPGGRRRTASARAGRGSARSGRDSACAARG